MGRESLSMIPESPSPTVVPESSLSPVSELRLGMFVSSDVAHPEYFVGDGLDPLSVHGFGEDGTAIDGSRSGRNASGLGSSSEAALLSDSSLVQLIDMVRSPSQAVNSVLSAVAISANPRRSEREVSLTGTADSIYVPVTEVAKTDRIPASAKGLIRRGFFGPRIISPSSVLKEAFVSSQSFKIDSSLGAEELCRVREASLPPSLPVLSSSPSSKVDIVEVCSTVSTSSLGAVELVKVLAKLFLAC